MLCLTRKTGERIVIPALDITITAVECSNGKVRIGIVCPREHAVHREEVWEKIKMDNGIAAEAAAEKLSTVWGVIDDEMTTTEAATN